MYANGRGVAQDDQQAVAWYRKAAEQGLADARYSLGLAYENGRGVPQDNTQAIAWFRKAADQGVNAAKTKLDNLESSQNANQRR
jgi:TPR repeat protein